MGNPEGKGVFFPNGLNGVITKPTGFAAQDPGTASFYKAVPSGQARRHPNRPFSETVAQLGPVSPPITGPVPATVPGENQISEAITSVLDNGEPGGRGLNPPPTTFTIQSK
ncbi:hypothetical protein WJX81_001636 [Elliptochloris bilobata]|uniref:Uncharacterized protein n=1 Tax=Elliptochloris bilobata TaxID=381761 RepID=A0AAW1QVQ2_9CHLO